MRPIVLLSLAASAAAIAEISTLPRDFEILQVADAGLMRRAQEQAFFVPRTPGDLVQVDEEERRRRDIQPVKIDLARSRSDEVVFDS